MTANSSRQIGGKDKNSKYHGTSSIHPFFLFYISSDIPWPGLNISRKSEISVSMDGRAPGEAF